MIHNTYTTLINSNNSSENYRFTHVRVRIPQIYHQEPILSNLISQQGLNITINAALLGGNAKGDGWFDLKFQGTAQQIYSALIYLSDLDIEVWHESSAEPDGW